MARILVVEDDEFFRDVLKSVLTRAGHQVDSAADGKTAQHVIGLRGADLVISDIRMPRMNGVELVRWIKSERSLPVILMTGFSELLETEDAFQLGADDFLPKPFEDADLMTAIEKCLSKPGQATGSPESPEELEARLEEEDERYCKIPISDFVYGRQIPFTIYIRLASGRYVKVAYTGEDITAERINIYREKNVKYLYMTQDDFRKCVGFNLDLARKVRSAHSVPKSKKKNFMRYTGELILEQSFVHGVNEEDFSMAKEYLDTALPVLMEDPMAFDLLNALNDHSDHLYAHSVGVSMYSVMIGKRMGWHSPNTVFKLSMAALFHDVGKKEIDRDILEKPRPALSQLERKIVERHPTIGMEILSSLKTVTSDIPEIIGQHHEDCIGTGYPQKFRKNRIHPMARVIAVADEFCNYALKGPYSNGLSARDAFGQLEIYHKPKLDAEALYALRKICGM